MTPRDLWRPRRERQCSFAMHDVSRITSLGRWTGRFAGIAAGAILATIVPGPVAAQSGTAIFNNMNTLTVTQRSPGPPNATSFKCPAGTASATITQIATYHWNDGKGATPGIIALQQQTGGGGYSTIGQWQASGSSGQGGAQNVNWTVNPNFHINCAGNTFAVIVSSGPTWSYNSASGNAGFAKVYASLSASAPAGGSGGGTAGTTSGGGASAFTPCHANANAVAQIGTCVGPPGTAIPTKIINVTSTDPALVFVNPCPAASPSCQQSVVRAAIKATLTAAGGGLMTAAAPSSLCALGSNEIWQVWMGEVNSTTTSGQIGAFTITGCP